LAKFWHASICCFNEKAVYLVVARYPCVDVHPHWSSTLL
jgi:hypothetical protein